MIIVALLLGGGLSVSGAFASTEEIAFSINELLVGKPKGHFNSEQRAAVAKSLEKYWESFLSRIPRLSPSEYSWVEQELKSVSPERSPTIYARTEYSKYQLTQHATDCRNIFQRLSTNVSSPRVETYLWVKSLNCHIDIDSNLAQHLQRLDLILQRYDASFYIAVLPLWASSTINGILEDILN